MTEIYYGPCDPFREDRSKRVEEDPYHPRYPDAGPYKKAEGLGKKPVNNADQTMQYWVEGKIVR